MARRIYYFDHAAATPMAPTVQRLVAAALKSEYANPSSSHMLGRLQRDRLVSARKSIAQVLGAKPAEIVFTSGSTEAINTAIAGVTGATAPIGSVIISAVEHEAVVAAAERAQSEGHHLSTVAVGADGRVDIELLKSLISDSTCLICIQYVNNEIGTIQPIRRIASLVADVRAERKRRGVTMQLLLFCDAAQAGTQNLKVSSLGVDLMSLGGGKLGALSGTGVLYVRTGTPLTGLLAGTAEGGRRGGTPNVVGAEALAAALQLVQSQRVVRERLYTHLQQRLLGSLEPLGDRLWVAGSAKSRVGGIITLGVDGCDGEELAARLDAAGFAVATGAACHASSGEPSAVLRAIGLPVAQAQTAIRISFGPKTSVSDTARLGAAIVRLCSNQPAGDSK